MNAVELQKFVRSKIPLAEFMQVAVIAAEPDSVKVGAPIEPNSNVHSTLFGGSATAIGLIAAWCLVFQRMQQDALGSNLVVIRQTTTYLRPVTAAFTAAAKFENETVWSDFVAALRRKGRARLFVTALIQQDGEIGARIEAEFAADVRGDQVD